MFTGNTSSLSCTHERLTKTLRETIIQFVFVSSDAKYDITLYEFHAVMPILVSDINQCRGARSQQAISVSQLPVGQVRLRSPVDRQLSIFICLRDEISTICHGHGLNYLLSTISSRPSSLGHCAPVLVVFTQLDAADDLGVTTLCQNPSLAAGAPAALIR